MIEFDNNGYISNELIIATDLDTFAEYFTFNEWRLHIFKLLKLYLLELSQVGITINAIWLDGSFVTQKNIPNDLDVIVFIHGDYLNSRFLELDILRHKYSLLHIFYAEWYPQNHPLAVITQYEQEKWKAIFGSDRVGIVKGLIEVKI